MPRIDCGTNVARSADIWAEISASTALSASEPAVAPRLASRELRSGDSVDSWEGSKLPNRLGAAAAAAAAPLDAESAYGSGLVSGAARNHRTSGVAALKFHSLLVASATRSLKTNCGS